MFSLLGSASIQAYDAVRDMGSTANARHRKWEHRYHG